LCKITSKGPCSERGRDSSIDTKLIPFFLTKHMTRNSSRSTKEKNISLARATIFNSTCRASDNSIHILSKHTKYSCNMPSVYN
jgi:hypothetical protein